MVNKPNNEYPAYMIYDTDAPPFCELLGFSRDTFLLNDNLSGGHFFREDTLEQKVYFLEFRMNGSEQGIESLLYDFSLEVGDTLKSFQCTGGYSEYNVIIHSIDTIIDRYGTPRRVFLGDDSFYDMMEGIGFNYPFNYPCLLVGAGSGCFFYDIVPDEEPYCYDFITASSNLIDSPIHLYPNPVQDHLYLREVDQTIFINIYNSMGQLMLSRSIDQDNNLYLSDTPSGIYMVEILDRSGRLIKIKKIVKG